MLKRRNSIFIWVAAGALALGAGGAGCDSGGGITPAQDAGVDAGQTDSGQTDTAQTDTGPQTDTVSDTATDTAQDDTASDTATDTGQDDTASDTATDTVQTDTASDTATDTAQTDTAQDDTAQTDTGSDTATDTGPGCPADACTIGDQVCSDDMGGLVVCEDDGNGCGAETTTACGDGQLCLGSGAAAACTNAVLEVQPLGTDIVAVTQKLPLQAQLIVGDGTVQPLDSGEVTWAMPDQSLAEVVTEGGQDLLHGLARGGGDQYAPDGTLWLAASYGPLTSEQIPFQVVELGEGTSLSPTGPTPNTEAPEKGIPAPPGPARYDGLYPLDGGAVDWYCNQTTDCPPNNGGTCDPARHACVDSSGKLVPKMSNHCTWNQDACAPHEADVRLFVGERMDLGLSVRAKYSEFGTGVMAYAPPTDWAGPGDPPEVPRPLHIDWEVVPGEATDVVSFDADGGGGITALKPGRTAVTGWVGLQGITFEVVTYDVRGYVPTEDYAPGVTFEDGHLVLFSSSHGPAAAGTHDTVRVVDLSDYHEQDRRPSKYGPQGLRLKENGDELFGGGGCGMIQGADGEVFLLNGRIALSLDTTTMTQGRNDHQVNFTDGTDEGFQVCQGAYWKDPDSGQEFLFGAEMAGKDKGPVRLWWTDITNLANENRDAVAFNEDPLPKQTDTFFFQPTVWTDADGQAWLLGVSPGVPNIGGFTSNLNYLHFIPLSMSGPSLLFTTTTGDAFDINQSVPAGLPADLATNGWMAHPGLQVATFHGNQGDKDMAFVGNDESISVIDLEAHAPISYADINPDGKEGLETRWYGWAIKDFALSPDGNKLYAVPYLASPQSPIYCTTNADCDFTGDGSWTCNGGAQCVDATNNVVQPGNTTIDYRSSDGSIKQTTITSQSVAVIDLSQGDRPMFDTTLWSCYREDASLCDTLPDRKPGIDLRQIAFKKFFLDQGFTSSPGALPAVLALNIRQIAASDESLFLIGADFNDGQGSALANLTDLAVLRTKPGDDGHTPYGVVFRGYRGDGYGDVGLSDAFGFRLGDRDAELGQARVKNAGILYLPGAPPLDNSGNGTPIEDDDSLPPSDHYANAPDLPADDAGHLVVVGSAPGATMGVMRDVDLTSHTEVDNDDTATGAQGVQLVENGANGATPLQGACGLVRGKGDVVWVFTGSTAVPFDSKTMTQLDNGNYVSWPGGSGIRFCTGAYWENANGLQILYGVDMDAEPGAPLAYANVGGLADGNADAEAVSHGPNTYLAPYTVASHKFFPRFVQAEVLGDTLYLLEKNEARSKFRNVVHRFPINTNSGTPDAQPDGDLWAEYTAEPLFQWGDPGMALADFPAGDANATPHLFVGNQNSVTIYDLGADPTATSAATRENYNKDNDGIQDDLDTTLFGRSMAAFTVSPDGTRLFGLPYVKSGRLPVDKILVPMVDGGTRAQGVDRYRVLVLDITDASSTGRPEVDDAINNGNGIDLVYRYMKQQIVDDGVSPGMLPPLFYTVRRQLVASNRSIFILGFDNFDGTGSALSLVNDIGMFDIATGQGYILGPTGDVGYPTSAAPWGFQLGVDADGLKADGMPRGMVSGAIWVP